MASHSGIRGIYGESITPDLVIKLTKAFVSLWKVNSVVVGRDTRPSGEAMEHAVLSALADLGCKTYVVGIQPTPVILWTCKSIRADGAIIISASHNPPEWNALKFALKGMLLDVDEVSKLMTYAGEGRYLAVGGRRAITLSFDPLEEYMREAIKFLDVEAIKRREPIVVIDPGGGAGSIATPLLLRKLGCKVITINSAPGLFSREVEPSPSALSSLSKAVKAHEADVGFAHDADADRLVCVADGGEVLAEDYGLAIASIHVLSNRKGPLVVSVASSMVFKWIAEKMGVNIYWSPVGEARVVRTILEHQAPIGGEGSSGGIIPAFFNLARDGVFGAALIVEALTLSESRLSEYIKRLPKYYQAKEAVNCHPSKYEVVMKNLISEFYGEELDLTDGIKLWLRDGWILIRPSQTEPKIRILCEATSKDSVQVLLRKYLNIVKGVVERVERY
ncbi:MAG: hypothetical protein QW701_00390 [Candidatus Nezhaarchaeales archaeon]